MIADMHCHSRVSDGSLGIDEMIYFAKRAGLSFLALTDHDTMAGVTRAQVLGKRYGLEVLAGVEISCRDEQTDRPVHLLCYLPDKPDRLEGMLRQTLEHRNAAGKQMIQKVMRFYPITPEHVAKYYTSSQAIYRVHITHSLMDLGYCATAYGPLYDELFADTGSCRVKFEYPTVEEALKTIQFAGGIAVFAHPSEPDNMELCERLAAEGRIQGIECCHPRVDEARREQLLALCQKHNLVATGGSDFHGCFTPHPNPLGTCIAPEDAVSRLYALKKHTGR